MPEPTEDAHQRREHEEAIEHERALLGSVLTDPSLALAVSEHVSREDFVDSRLGNAFSLVVRAANGTRSSQEISLSVIWAGYIRFVELGEILRDYIDPGFGWYHATEVRDRSQRRQDDPTAATKRASRLLDAYLRRIHDRDLPQLYQLDDVLDGMEIGPELITLIGAPPGAGKTELASQIMLERLHVYEDPDLDSLRDLRDRRPGLVLVDYLQKFVQPDKEVRVCVGMVMNELRRCACGSMRLRLNLQSAEPMLFE